MSEYLLKQRLAAIESEEELLLSNVIIVTLWTPIMPMLHPSKNPILICVVLISLGSYVLWLVVVFYDTSSNFHLALQSASRQHAALAVANPATLPVQASSMLGLDLNSSYWSEER